MFTALPELELGKVEVTVAGVDGQPEFEVRVFVEVVV